MQFRPAWSVFLLLLLASYWPAVTTTAWAQCEFWSGSPLVSGGLSGANGPVLAAATWDPDGPGAIPERLVVGGSFDSIGGVEASNVAYYDPSARQWQAMGPGVATTVNDITVVDGQVLIVCNGDEDPATLDATVQRWTGSSWQSIGWTERGSVYAILSHGGRLYIGGAFETQYPAGGTTTANFAVHDPVTNSWAEAGFGEFDDYDPGLEWNAVRALHAFGGYVFAGGSVSYGGQATPRLVYGNFGGGWQTLVDENTGGRIRALADFAGELLIGGSFAELEGVVCNGMAGWNGSSLRALDEGVANTASPFSGVHCIALYDGIVIGGDFDRAGGTPAPNIARMLAGETQWQGLGTQGPDNYVSDLVVYQDRLFTFGSFTSVPTPADNIAVWNGGFWQAISGGYSFGATAFVPYNGRLAVGGNFQRGDLQLDTVNNVGTWNGTALLPLGSGTNAQIHALEAFKYPGFQGSHELIAGGAFTTAGGVTALRIARWNEKPNVAFPPPAWEPMGSGFNSNVNAIERSSGSTYAGGNFTFSGSTPIAYVARWNETTDVWESVGGGTNGAVYAIHEFNGQLYVGGAFTFAGGVPTGGLARWNGSSWSSVGGWVDGTVYALEVHDGSLFAGGLFNGLPGGSNFARFDGNTWYATSSGSPDAAVRSVLSTGTELFVGGDFTSIAGATHLRVARWAENAWHPVLGGVDGAVRGLGLHQGQLHVGGNISNAYPSQPIQLYSGWVRYTANDLPRITLQPVSRVGEILGSTTFSATATGGSSPLTYQWLHRDVPLVDGQRVHGSFVTGALSEALTLSTLVLSDAGEYRLDVTNDCGTVSTSTVLLEYGVTSAPQEGPRHHRFDAAGPNPASGPTILSFTLARQAKVDFSVYDLRGRLVRQVNIGRLDAGAHQATWDVRDGQGRDIGAGVYFVQLVLDGEPMASRRVTIVR